MNLNRSNRWYLIIPLALIFQSGCVYFNTFFMAQKKFKEAEESQRKAAEQRQDQEFRQEQNKGGGRVGDQGNKAPVGGGGSDSGRKQTPAGQAFAKASPQERNLYEDAIKKASKVLSDHPDSKWVDNALFLIGKSYFNMADYSSADRKFSELVTNHPQSKFAADSYFFKGLCQIELGNEVLASKAFESVEKEFPKSEYVDEICFARGKLAEDKKEYSGAIGFFKTYLEKFSNEDSAAQAQYSIGQCHEELGNYYDAYAAYSDVKKYNPTRRLQFESALASGSVILETDSAAVGMRILTDLSKDERYFSQLGRIRLKIAEGYYLTNEIDKSVKEYTAVTQENPKSFQSAEAYYRLGLIYQSKLFDIEKAKESFTKAQSENPASEFRNLALARSAQIAKFENYQVQLLKADSVRTIEQMKNFPEEGQAPPDSAGMDGSLEARDGITTDTTARVAAPDSTLQAIGNEMLSAPDTMVVLQAIPDTVDTAAAPVATDNSNMEAQAPGGTGQASGEDSLGTQSSPDSVFARAGDSASTDTVAGNQLPFIGPVPESADSTAADTTWSMAKVDSVMGGSSPIQVDEESLRLQDSLIAEENRKHAREDSIRQAIIESGIETRFLLAELYAYELNQPDSAFNEYRLIVEQYPTSPYASKSLLAAANLRINSGDSVSAKEYLRRLVDYYPESPQASVAADILKFPLDFSRNAMGLYASAESLAFEGDNPDSAAALFGYIAVNFPDLAPKAAFARAWAIDLAKQGADSAAFYAYEAVSKNYPRTIYAEAASERIGKSAAPKNRKFSGVERPMNEGQGDNKPDTSGTFAGGLPLAPPVKVLGEFVYPQSLLDRRLKGQVLFKIKINLFGKVEEHEIIGPSGERAIDSSATAALLQTEFDTSKLDLAQLDSYFRYSIPFERPDINIFNDPYREEQRDRR